MSGSHGPRAGLDRGVAALRWLLVSAQDDPSARAQVLPALSRCTVLLPTMTGAPEKLRFLAQPGGGNAMVVFTGHDALEHAAKKLGWAQGTQSVSFRALPARDALETASLQGVRAVIVDAAAEHALELRYDEVSMYLSRGTGEFAPDFVEPSSRGTGEYGQPPPRRTTAPVTSARVTGELASRGTGERSVAEVREEVVTRKARDARRDDGGGMRARVERAMAASEPLAVSEPAREARPAPLPAPSPAPATGPARPRQVTQPMPRIQDPSAQPDAAPRKRNLAEIDDPFISSTPRQAPAAAAAAGGQVRRVPSLAAPPLSRDMPSSPFETSRPPSSPTREDETPIAPLAAHAVAYRRAKDETIPLEDISSAQAARASAERASMRVDKDKVREPADGAKEAEPEPRGTGTAPKPAPVPAPAPHEAGEPATDPHGPMLLLTSAVLSAIADELRKFPEVEWACELPDEGEAPKIGIRVDPSYLARTHEIEAGVLAIARKAGALVVPLIVSAPAPTKDARARGRMFFPWRKKNK